MRNGFVMGVVLRALVGCQPSSSANDSADEGDGLGDSEEGDGDGDGDGDPTQYCDVSELPTLEPVWALALPDSPIGSVILDRLAVTGDAVFISGIVYQDIHNGPSSRFLARRAIEDGHEEWFVEAPDYRFDLAANGEHVYYHTETDIRRCTLDGILDANWSAVYPPDFGVRSFAFGGDDDFLLLYGSEITEWGDPPFSDAVVATFSDQGNQLSKDYFGDSRTNESATMAIAHSSGGFYFAYTTEMSTAIRSFFTIEEFSADLPVPGGASTTFIDERPDGLIVAGANLNGGIWVSKLNQDGSESWRKELTPCGQKPPTLFSVRKTADRVWGLTEVKTGADTETVVIVQFDFNGELLGSHTVAGFDPNVFRRTLATDGENAVVVGGYGVPDGEPSYVARLQ